MDGNPVDIPISLCSKTSTVLSPTRGWVVTIQYWLKGCLPTGQWIRKDIHRYEVSSVEKGIDNQDDFRNFLMGAATTNSQIAQRKAQEIKEQLTGRIDVNKAFEGWIVLQPEKVKEPPLRNPFRGM